MKAYKSHKIVEAAKITIVATNPEGSAILVLQGIGTEIHEMVPRSWMDKHTEGGRVSLIGGYFVRYPDGYTSWSPAAAFEEGYTEHGLTPAEGALPVAGYKPQTQTNVDCVNAMKAREELILRQLDSMKDDPEIDQRWLSIGRTGIETGFMAINRSIFRPGRVAFPEESV